MDLQLVDYAIYIMATVVLTIWVGLTLSRNGRPFLVSVFKEEGLADSVNHLLVVGFYLVNFGAAKWVQRAARIGHGAEDRPGRGGGR